MKSPTSWEPVWKIQDAHFLLEEHTAERASCEVPGMLFIVLLQKYPQEDSHFLFSGLNEGGKKNKNK